MAKHYDIAYTDLEGVLRERQPSRHLEVATLR